MLAEAQRSHPLLTHAGQTLPSTTYDAEATPFEGELSEPRPPVEQLDIGIVPMPDIRRQVAASAADAGLDPDRVADLVLAVTEAATNTIRHAGDAGVLRIWHDAGRVVCEVRDRGRIRDPLAGRLPVSEDRPDGRGLWLINQLCDFVQIRSSDDGSVVRMHVG